MSSITEQMISLVSEETLQTHPTPIIVDDTWIGTGRWIVVVTSSRVIEPEPSRRVRAGWVLRRLWLVVWRGILVHAPPSSRRRMVAAGR